MIIVGLSPAIICVLPYNILKTMWNSRYGSCHYKKM